MQGHKYWTRQISHQRAVRVRRRCTAVPPSAPQHTVQGRNTGDKEIGELEQLLLASYDIIQQHHKHLRTWQQNRDSWWALVKWKLYYKSLYCWKVSLRCWHAVGEELYTFSFKDAVFLSAKSHGSERGYENSLLCETAQGIYRAPRWTCGPACLLLLQTPPQLTACISCSR